ncbi:hypothetical protein A6E22_27440, partial [Bacillus cereus]
TDKINVKFEKPDKTVVFQDKEVELLDKEKGKIKVLLTSQTLVKAGDVKGQISIERTEDGTRKRVNTYDFSFKVRSSIASNDSIESTNEFQIFDKIMVAGEKFKDFEGEDFDKLIAAGELAKGALPKSGGTMTGNIDMDISVGAKSKGYRWRDATGALFGLESATDGALILYDYKNLARVWQYDPVAKRFTVLSDTNLLKTTGGTITGTTIFEAGDLRFKNAANDILFRNNTSGIFSFYDIAQNQVVWSYNPATKEFTVNSASNLLKKTGDTMTGTFVLSSANAEINFKDEKSEVAIQKTSAGNIAMWDRKNQKTVWLYVPESNEFRLQATKSNIVTSDKDGRATITLPPEAELTSSDGVIADRKSNMVTLRARIRRKSDQISTVFVMPSDMRPLLTVTHNIIANDGTVGALSIGTSGDVKISSVGPSLLNKDFNFTITYVAAG